MTTPTGTAPAMAAAPKISQSVNLTILVADFLPFALDFEWSPDYVTRRPVTPQQLNCAEARFPSTGHSCGPQGHYR
jgi:hypothetical protein